MTQKIKDGVSDNAKGGTELMADRLFGDLPESLMSRFQIWFSRYRPEQVDKSKYQIFYAHDLPGDPESEFLKNGGWRAFHKLIFVSNWQMQNYCGYYGIPYGACFVMANAIKPIDFVRKGLHEEIRIGYWSTPHRGLNILVPVFEFLSQKYPEIQLDVFSSFKLYGWEERDAPYQELFEKCKAHPKINYHGTVGNLQIREYAAEADIFAYPSIWPETSCLCLMEAMSAGLVCVHSNLAALYETSANWTSMYQFNEDLNEHAKTFHIHLEKAINSVKQQRKFNRRGLGPRIEGQKQYTDLFYDWSIRKEQWLELLQQIAEMPNTNTIILSK
jgi:UDP-glucose:(glucosyl)LPS alpha-1,2-glucosyltransferase